MIKAQRIIKYCAIAFAIFLTINIISAIMFGIISIGNIFGNNDNNQTDTLTNLNIKTNAKILDIEVKNTNITIKKGYTLKAETNNKNIKVNQNNNKISIEETRHNYFNKNTNTNLVIYLPSDYIFNEVSIENGAGKINIDWVHTEKLNLDLGAGKVDINNLTVTKSIDIDGGAGEVTITNGNINNLDLDIGIGKITLMSTVTGNNDIDAGIGDLDLNLIGNSYDYKIKVNKGIGNAALAGEKIVNDSYYGEGSNIINIDGGIGNININYTK